MTAYDRIVDLAKSKLDGTVTIEKAVDQVLREEPTLYDEYCLEKEGTSAGVKLSWEVRDRALPYVPHPREGAIRAELERRAASGPGKNIARLTARAKGGTFEGGARRALGVPVTEGVAVGEWPESSCTLQPPADITDPVSRDKWCQDHIEEIGLAIDDWINDNGGAIASKSSAYGTWINENTGNLSLDLVKIYPEKQLEDAKKAGKIYGQEGVFNISALTRNKKRGDESEQPYIPTGGKATAVGYTMTFDRESKQFVKND